MASVANVMGSAFAMRRRSPMSITAASSPTRGPMSTRGPVGTSCARRAVRRAAGSLPGERGDGLIGPGSDGRYTGAGPQHLPTPGLHHAPATVIEDYSLRGHQWKTYPKPYRP